MGNRAKSREEALGNPTQVYSARLGVTRLEWDPCGGPEPRRNAEVQVGRDMLKPLEQLVCDVHEEASARRPVEVNLVHAIKRMVSMMARVAKSNDRLAKRMFWLTIAIAAMTVVTLGLGILKACGAI